MTLSVQKLPPGCRLLLLLAQQHFCTSQTWADSNNIVFSV